MAVLQLSKCLVGASSAFGSSPLSERTLLLVLRRLTHAVLRGTGYVGKATGAKVASASELCGTCGSLVKVTKLNLPVVCWSCALPNAMLFFLFRRRAGSVVCLCLGVAGRGFLSVDDFLTLLSP